MVSRRRWTPVLPRHAPCLTPGDYLTYFGSGWGAHGDPAPEVERLWEPLLGSCQIIPTPTGRQALWEFLERATLRSE